MDFMVSAGHDEYPLNDRDREYVTLVWSYEYDDDPDDYAYTPEWEQKLHDMFVEEVGTEPDTEWDLGWENIYHVVGPVYAISGMLRDLLKDLDVELGGDDDTFDYWPSGVRMAIAIAAHLKGGWPMRVEELAHRIINEQAGSFAPELYDKVGLEPE